MKPNDWKYWSTQWKLVELIDLISEVIKQSATKTFAFQTIDCLFTRPYWIIKLMSWHNAIYFMYLFYVLIFFYHLIKSFGFLHQDWINGAMHFPKVETFIVRNHERKLKQIRIRSFAFYTNIGCIVRMHWPHWF